MSMKKDVLILFAAIVILGGTFAGYLNWLYIQPRPKAVQIKAPPPKSSLAPPKTAMRQVIAAHPATS